MSSKRITKPPSSPPEIRHLNRTHNVCLKWMHEVVSGPNFELQYCNTKDQIADIFTKPFPNRKASEWMGLIILLGIQAAKVSDSKKGV